MANFIDKLRSRLRVRYAQVYEEVATLEGVDGMDPLEEDEGTPPGEERDAAPPANSAEH